MLRAATGRGQIKEACSVRAGWSRGSSRPRRDNSGPRNNPAPGKEPAGHLGCPWSGPANLIRAVTRNAALSRTTGPVLILVVCAQHEHTATEIATPAARMQRRTRRTGVPGSSLGPQSGTGPSTAHGPGEGKFGEGCPDPAETSGSFAALIGTPWIPVVFLFYGENAEG